MWINSAQLLLSISLPEISLQSFFFRLGNSFESLLFASCFPSIELENAKRVFRLFRNGNFLCSLFSWKALKYDKETYGMVWAGDKEKKRKSKEGEKLEYIKRKADQNWCVAIMTSNKYRFSSCRLFFPSMLLLRLLAKAAASERNETRTEESHQ